MVTMTYEDAKDYLPLVKAMSEGKTIQFLNNENEWIDVMNFCVFSNPKDYRIKPEQTYRAYKTTKEFADAMKEHGPLVQFSENVYDLPFTINYLSDNVLVNFTIPRYGTLTGEQLLEYRWQDGTICGIKN